MLSKCNLCRYIQALRTGGVGTDLGLVAAGQLVVVSIDAPSLQLW